MNMKIIWMSVLLVLSILTGIILTVKGRPMGVLLMNVHKLISLGFIVLAFLAVRNHLRGAEGDVPLVLTILGILAAVALFVLLVTGSILTRPEPVCRSLVFMLHTAAAVIGLISSGGLVYFLVAGK